MATNTDVKAELARRDNGEVDASGKPTVYRLLEQVKPQLQRALPRHMTVERFARVALTALRQNPRLMSCTPESLLGALFLSAQLGLEPGPLGHAYLVPFRNRKQGTVECQWIIGYTGIIDLARRSGHIETMMARAVREGDHFVYEYGLNERLEHRPSEDHEPAADGSDITHVYALAKYVGGGHNFVVLTRGQVEKFRARSKSAKDGPWVTDWEPMALKTAVKRLRPFLPLSVEMADAFAADEQSWALTPDEETVDVTAVEVDEPVDEEPDDASEPVEKQDADTGRLSPQQYQALRDAGIDTDEKRAALVFACTDGRTRSSQELTDVDKRRVVKAGALIGAKVLAVGVDDAGDAVLWDVERDVPIPDAETVDGLVLDGGGDG